MSKSKTSRFEGAGEGLFGEVKPKQKAQEVQEVQEVHNREYGTTQGRKGQKAKRINMAFSDANHKYITEESRRRGISATAFVNKIIDEYKSRR